jgi:hypothetical protein
VQQQGPGADEFDQSERARLAARAAIEAGYGVDQAAQYAAAADRQISRDSPRRTPARSSRAARPGTRRSSVRTFAAPPSVGYKTVVNGRVLHVYPNRKKPVVVRRVARSR